MTSTKSNLATAIVARGPASAGQWQLETVTHRSLKEDEVLVRIVASGICLADVHFGDVSILNGDESPAVYYPRVLGHEGEFTQSSGGDRVSIEDTLSNKLEAISAENSRLTCYQSQVVAMWRELGPP